jgi:putative aminopeptidase FrvX
MNINSLKELLRDYCLTPALAGYESKMAEKLKFQLEKYCDSTYIDKVGNVIGTIKGTDATAPSVMVYAHMDNIGFVIKKIEKDGFIRLERNGAPIEKALQGQGVVVGNEQGPLGHNH